MKNFGAFIVITHYYTPIPRTDQVSVNEMVEFVDRIRPKHSDGATAIIDYLNKKMIKNRAKDTGYEAYIEYLQNKYSTEMGKLDALLGIADPRRSLPAQESIVGENISDAIVEIQTQTS